MFRQMWERAAHFPPHMPAHAAAAGRRLFCRALKISDDKLQPTGSGFIFSSCRGNRIGSDAEASEDDIKQQRLQPVLKYLSD